MARKTVKQMAQAHVYRQLPPSKIIYRTMEERFAAMHAYVVGFNAGRRSKRSR